MTEYTVNVKSEKPAAIDATSSAFVVYQRRNFQLSKDEDGKDIWQYEERELSKLEYAELRAKELEEELTQTQLALTEIYESEVVNNG